MRPGWSQFHRAGGAGSPPVLPGLKDSQSLLLTQASQCRCQPYPVLSPAPPASTFLGSSSSSPGCLASGACLCSGLFPAPLPLLRSGLFSRALPSLPFLSSSFLFFASALSHSQTSSAFPSPTQLLRPSLTSGAAFPLLRPSLLRFDLSFSRGSPNCSSGT